MKNILLLAMSTLPKETEKDNYYQYQKGEVFVARSQLEPITYMIDSERKKWERNWIKLLFWRQQKHWS